MPAQQPVRQTFEIADNFFSQSFVFPIEDDVSKTVSVERQGQVFSVSIHYQDDGTEDGARETFEADGPVTVSLADSGLYITSCRALLSGRIRLRRTRFF